MKLLHPHKKEMIDALGTIQQLVQSWGTENNFDDNRKYEKLVRDLLVCNLKQSSIQGYFSKDN